MAQTQPSRRPIAGPFPFFRLLHHVRPDRIENDVACKLEQISFLLHQDRLVAPLEYMPYGVMSPVKRLGVHPVELSHPPGQGGIDRLDQQVVVIHHQAIRMTEPVEPFDRLFQYLEEPLPIGIVEKDILIRAASSRKTS